MKESRGWFGQRNKLNSDAGLTNVSYFGREL